jgi:hypothetical protein
VGEEETRTLAIADLEDSFRRLWRISDEMIDDVMLDIGLTWFNYSGPTTQSKIRHQWRRAAARKLVVSLVGLSEAENNEA